MKLELTILLTTLFLVFLIYPVDAGTTMTSLSKTVQYIQADKIAEQMKEAKESSQAVIGKDRLDEIKGQADNVLKSSSSLLVKKIVTVDRVRLMQSMKHNRIFIEQMASTMRNEFKNYELTQYEDNVRVVLRFTETQARKGNNLNRALGILNDIANYSASSPLGSMIYCGSYQIN